MGPYRVLKSNTSLISCCNLKGILRSVFPWALVSSPNLRFVKLCYTLQYVRPGVKFVILTLQIIYSGPVDISIVKFRACWTFNDSMTVFQQLCSATLVSRKYAPLTSTDLVMCGPPHFWLGAGNPYTIGCRLLSRAWGVPGACRCYLASYSGVLATSNIYPMLSFSRSVCAFHAVI